VVRDRRVLLIDVSFAEARPTPWRQAVNLANMMLCLALRSSPERVYHRALRQFSLEEITEAFAATRGLAMPSQLRHLLRERSRDLHAEFLALLSQRPRPVSIQRWNLRRVGLAWWWRSGWCWCPSLRAGPPGPTTGWTTPCSPATWAAAARNHCG
jgi:hypothetical protein